MFSVNMPHMYQQRKICNMFYVDFVNFWIVWMSWLWIQRMLMYMDSMLASKSIKLTRNVQLCLIISAMYEIQFDI